MTRFIVEFRVRPQLVSGRGIPFEPRWMWCVQDWSHLEGDEPREQLTPRSAFWSRRVAEAFAAERVKAMVQFLHGALASPLLDTVPCDLPVLGKGLSTATVGVSYYTMTSERAADEPQLRLSRLTPRL